MEGLLEESRLIPLTRGQSAIVDADDYEALSKWKWFAHWESHTQTFYACRSVNDPNAPKTVWMHREVLGLKPKDGMIADHIDRRATLDNRRINLRIADRQQSMANRGPTRKNKNGAKGCSWNNGSYLVRIGVGHRTVCLGRKKNIEEAKALYVEGAKRYHGEFARTE